MPDFEALWAEAIPFDEFVAASPEYGELWAGMHRLARIPEWAAAAAAASPPRRLLVLAEDWCTDGFSTVPVLARWTELAPGVELRILRRDEHPALMDRYLTDGARAIPVVIALDEGFRELGDWGPRPAALQEWVRENRASIAKADLIPRIRRWYARDRGESALRELMGVAGLEAVEVGGQ
jgi:hypothetical protein